LGLFFAQWLYCIDSEESPKKWFNEFQATIQKLLHRNREKAALKAANSFLEDSKSKPADSFYYKSMRHSK
ncbi:hypothetical protein, partial [Leptospira stimsonii]